jgi:hypothetical protein
MHSAGSHRRGCHPTALPLSPSRRRPAPHARAAASSPYQPRARAFRFARRARGFQGFRACSPSRRAEREQARPALRGGNERNSHTPPGLLVRASPLCLMSTSSSSAESPHSSFAVAMSIWTSASGDPQGAECGLRDFRSVAQGVTRGTLLLQKPRAQSSSPAPAASGPGRPERGSRCLTRPGRSRPSQTINHVQSARQGAEERVARTVRRGVLGHPIPA